MNNVDFVQNTSSTPLSNSSTLTAPLSNDSGPIELNSNIVEPKIETQIQIGEESRDKSSGNSNHVTDNLSLSRDSIPDLNTGTEIVKLEPEPEIQIETPDIEMHITNQLQNAIQKYNLRNNIITHYDSFHSMTHQ